MPQYVGSTKVRPLTERQAMATYRAVCAWLGQEPAEGPVRQGQQWPTGPVLVQDFESWHSEHDWAIVWEGGQPEGWPNLVPSGGQDEWGNEYPALDRPREAAGVLHMEAINGYALGLYRQT